MGRTIALESPPSRIVSVVPSITESILALDDVVYGIQATESTCKLFFHGWKNLKQAGYRLEGSGKHARHIKISSSEDLEPERVADMIEIAARR